VDDQRDIEADDTAGTARPGRVRIIGAEQAAPSREPPGEPPVADAAPDVEPESSGEPPAGGSDAPGDAELPHWTEAPTGQVPAVLNREGGARDGDPWSSVPAPMWREEHADWEAHEETYEVSMLNTGETRLGSLDDSGATDRQPWSFDLPGPDDALEFLDEPAPGADLPDDATIQVAAVDLGIDEPIGRHARPPVPAADDETAVGAVPIVVPDIDAPAAAPVNPDEPKHRRRLARSEPRAASRPVPPAPEETDRPAPDPARGAKVPLAPPSPPRQQGRSRPGGTGPGGGDSGGRNVPIAVVTGVIIGLVALVAFDLGTVLTLVLLTALATVAAAEAYAAFRRGGYHPVTLLGLVATASIMIATYNRGLAAMPLVVIMLFAFCVLWYLIGVEHGDAVRNIGATLLVFVWVGLLAAYGALLLNPALFPNRHGIAFLLGAVIAGVAYDVGAWAVGGWIGRHPMAPSISPNKTWEGFIGGAVSAVVASVVIVHFIHPWTLSSAFALGLVVSVVSPLGDLTESLIKRGLGLKDMSRVLPGHGGLLDRVDGLIFVLPATYYLVRALNLG